MKAAKIQANFGHEMEMAAATQAENERQKEIRDRQREHMEAEAKRQELIAQISELTKSLEADAREAEVDRKAAMRDRTMEDIEAEEGIYDVKATGYDSQLNVHDQTNIKSTVADATEAEIDKKMEMMDKMMDQIDDNPETFIRGNTI